jgi:hypothetical protein
MAWTINRITYEWETRTTIDGTQGTAVWLATSDVEATPYQAERAIGVSIGDGYPGDTSGYLKCKGRVAKGVDQTRKLFKVTADYDSSTQYYSSPLDVPTKVEYGEELSQETYAVDQDNLTMVNTAGQPFGELPTRDAGILVLTVTRNVTASTNYSGYLGFRRKTNNANVSLDGMTYATGTLLVKSISLSEVKEQNGVQYRTLQTIVHAREDGWLQEFESRGPKYKDGSVLKPIVDGDGTPIDFAWPLDSAGAKKTNATDEGYTISRRPYASATIF